MAQTGTYHGGLVFLGEEKGALERFSRIVSATLEDYGHMVERQASSAHDEASVVSAQYRVHLTYRAVVDTQSRSTLLDKAAGLNRKGGNRQPARMRLSLTLDPVSSESDDQDMSELMLVVMLYRMVDLYSTEEIEWLDTDANLNVEQFMSAFANVTPGKVRERRQIVLNGGERFAPVETAIDGLASRCDRMATRAAHQDELGLIELSEDEVLALAFRAGAHPDNIDGQPAEDEMDNDIRRLTSWGMTGCLAFVAAPVAIPMAAVNLIRGEDFRLNTQVLSLTSALVTLQSTGAMANVMSHMPL